MQIRGVLLVTTALFLGIAALVLHLLAILSPRWKITQRDRPPTMTPVSYGIWDRCESIDTTIIKQGVALGIRTNVQFCRPNVYMRYSPDKFFACYPIRRRCPVMKPSELPGGCLCRYLPSAKGLQWLTILAAGCLILGLHLLYLKIIVSPRNGSALFVLSYGPFICFVLTLLLMITGLILLGVFLRRDTYEDYSFPLKNVPDNTNSSQGFDLHSLRNYAKRYESTFTYQQYLTAKDELYEDANTHYHTNIGQATVYEIIATALIFAGTLLTLWLVIVSKSEDNKI